MIPLERADYLRQIAKSVRDYKSNIRDAADAADACYQSYGALKQLGCDLPAPLTVIRLETLPENLKGLGEAYNAQLGKIPMSTRELVPSNGSVTSRRSR